jgi:hypothetical protein
MIKYAAKIKIRKNLPGIVMDAGRREKCLRSLGDKNN